MRVEKSKSYCIGCTENFYNGNNEYGISECWSFKSAKLIKRKKVCMSQIPPWNQSAQVYMSCRREKGYVFVGEHVTR